MKIHYSDSEVGVFHPICEKALNLALTNLCLNDRYQVLHHQVTGSLEMDFVVENQNTGKYLCVIEVKKTKGAVYSERYQYQAMSYVQSAIERMEKPYYILTNLEFTNCYRYTNDRPRAYQQRLKNGSEFTDFIGNIITDGDLNSFIAKLSNVFQQFIQGFINDTFNYEHSFREFSEKIELYRTDSLSIWKSYLAVCFYQYIRGSQIQQNASNNKRLTDIQVFQRDIEKICDAALMLNFKSIFDYHAYPFAEFSIDNTNILSEMLNLGKQYPVGDKIADLLHYYVSLGKEIDGEVATDTELSKIVAILAHLVHGDIGTDECICDPAAGSGNLLHATVKEFSLSPDKILANDVNARLLEILSLRFGLEYIHTVSPNNSPYISSFNIESLPQDYFNSVGVLVINPPYVSGINCVDRKEHFFNRIRELTKKEPITNVGQMPLEGAFLELITYLVPKGTTIACVLAKSHLLARGVESKTIRRLILDSFGLRIMFDYPREKIFEHVIKDTFVFIGKLGQPVPNIDLVSCVADIPDVNTYELKKFLKDNLGTNNKYVGDGLSIQSFGYEQFNASIDDGWRFINPTYLAIKDFLDKNFYDNSLFENLDQPQFNLHRGKVANKGGSDLLYLNQKWFDADLRKKYHSHLKVGMRNADPMSMKLVQGDSDFLSSEILDSTSLDEIINVYMSYELQKDTTKAKQRKESKSLEQLKAIITRESLLKTPKNSILIPRDIRKYGKAYLTTTKETFVSTNFMILEIENYEDAYLLTTWFTTIFYQLMCESTTKNQEGTRKMERHDLVTTVIPKLTAISPNTKSELLSVRDINFLDLNNPQVRPVDIAWSKALFGSEYESMINKAKKYLIQMVQLRNIK